MKKILHLADVHFSKDAQDLAIASLETALEAGRRESIDAWAFAGDLFDRSTANSDIAGLPRLVAIIQKMLDVAPILSVSGTPSHDSPGCYRVFTELRAKNRFFNLEPGSGEIVNGILFLGLPEVGKEWFLAGSNGISKEEADQRIKEEVRKILLGLGALRAEHSDLPCVLLFHGMVAGASMQNGQLIDGGLAFGRDDLNMVGFTYGAFGHVHLDQKIEGMNAWYAGSAYPVNWGELGQVGCNLVELNEDPELLPVVTRIPFPHAPRKKIVALLSQTFAREDFDGYQVWYVARDTKENLAIFNPERCADLLKDAGALPGSRVTVELIPTETVRAAAITQKHALRDKLAIYAEASGEACTPGVNEKADELERAAAGAAAGQGAHIRLQKLRLRGAIGIWKGQGKDEIEVDFDRFDPGLIALVGENGAGKTTLIENCHPYPCMLTRDGTLQQHFRLRDSLRELTFVDERTGTEYRALIQIDGANASGSCEYHLFKGGEPLTNGRKADYEQAIERLFGSLPLFLRSAFVSQRATKNNPDLAEATKGEKKAIFRELAGLDYLQAYAETAKARATEIDQQVRDAAVEIRTKEEQLAELPTLRKDLEGKETFLAAARENEAKALEAGRKVKEIAQELQAQVLAYEKAAERELGLREQVQSREAQAAECEITAARAQQALAKKRAAQSTISDAEALRGREAEESEKQGKVNAERARLSSEYAAQLSAHRDAERAVSRRAEEARAAKASMEGDRRLLQAKVDRLTLDLSTPPKACPQCGYVDPEIQVKRSGWQVELQAALDKLAGLEKDLAAKDQEIASIVAETPPRPAEPKLPIFDDTLLRELRGLLAKLNVAQAQTVLIEAEKAGATIEEMKRRKEALQAEIRGLENEANGIRASLDPQVPARHKQALEDLEAARASWTKAREIVATIEAEKRGIEEEIRSLEELQKAIDGMREALSEQQWELCDWRYLERACGPDGIQALELDAMGPGIAEVANRLLSSAYGSRFQIEFRTTRIAGKGSRTRQVEDFSIWIHDGEAGTEQELSTLSGGESVWVRRAIYDAFGMIRDRSTGVRFLTVFQDEADGALDPEARRAYFEMLRAAHAESGRRHTVVITHSEEVQAMIGQQIRMGELAGVGA